jgi:N-acetyllactosaminide beta-1,3-N-acetylglucosaminyltransferase
MTWCKLVTALVGALTILQILNMTLLSQLQFKKKSPPVVYSADYTAEEMFEMMKKRIAAVNIIDGRGEYVVRKNVWKGTEMRHDRMLKDAALVTHCTVNRMFRLIDTAKHWRGPMSITVFTPGQDVIVAMEHVIRLYHCSAVIREQAVFNFVSPLAMPVRDVKPYNSFGKMTECRFMQKVLGSVLSIDNYGVKDLAYPNNLLRNTGITYSQTEYIFVVDVDLISSRELHQQFMEFARNNKLFSKSAVKDPVVFVVPVFEAIDEDHIPYDKGELLQMYNKGVRPFYLEPCPKCQKSTDFERWITLASGSALMEAYEVEWSHPWEPFFIGPRTMPAYDERFKQYGFNRVSQVRNLRFSYEMKHLGLKFH